MLLQASPPSKEEIAHRDAGKGAADTQDQSRLLLPEMQDLMNNTSQLKCCTLSPVEVLDVLNSLELDKTSLRRYFSCLSEAEFRPFLDWPRYELPAQQLEKLDIGQGGVSRSTKHMLEFLEFASNVYSSLSSATFPEKCFTAIFTGKASDMDLDDASPGSALRCVCFFESGGVAVDSKSCDKALATSAGNSLYVDNLLLSDPAKSTGTHSHSHQSVRRIIGNLAVPGISILLSPETMRKRKTSEARLVEQAPYDFDRQNSFSGVSLHLSLTAWKMPAYDGDVGVIDHELYWREAVISVMDRGKWVADVNIMDALEQCLGLGTLKSDCPDHDSKPSLELRASEISCIDNFDELFDPPLDIGIVRAHRNWAARLAAACTAVQHADTELPDTEADEDEIMANVFILPSEALCWECTLGDLEAMMTHSDSSFIAID